MEFRDKDAGQYSGWRLLGIAALGACALAVAYWAGWSPSGPDKNAAEKLGQMGDFFGGMLNPLVSALTLFVAISVWQLQKKELKATQKALDEQAKTAEQQRQEQRFFDLLNVYQQTVSSLFVVARMPSTSGEYPVQYIGKEAIAQFLRSTGAEQLRHFDEIGYGAWTAQATQVKRREDLVPFWINETTTSLLNHYLRVVFRVLRDVEALLGDQHFRYVKLFRAQLSRSELIILAYNLWLDDEGKKMIPLAEKYGLLKHLPKGHLRTTLEHELPPHVFGRTRAAELAALRPTATTEAMV